MAKCELSAERCLFKNGSATTGAIFALKNYGWKDQNSMDVTTQGKRLGFIALPALKSEQKTTNTKKKA